MITLTHPWLEFNLDSEMQVLSWSLNRPGFVTARRILWREVCNSDLSPDLDVNDWLRGELERHKAVDAVTMLTSRDIRQFTENTVKIKNVTAHAVATVGLSNAERVGHRIDRSTHGWGTINIAVRLNTGLTEAAMLETLSIAVQARTTAVMDIGLSMPKGVATGTGTDCIAIANPPGDERYAGLHTEIGEAVGRAVYTAVHKAAQQWAENAREKQHATP